jgi:hypothetical protein
VGISKGSFKIDNSFILAVPQAACDKRREMMETCPKGLLLVDPLLQGFWFMEGKNPP